MSKILVSLCGVGMGHASRETPLIKELMKSHEVKVTSYNDGFKYINEFHPEINLIKPSKNPDNKPARTPLLNATI
jgi:hypothetical protein